MLVVSYLALQARVSFCGVSEKVPHFCFCRVRVLQEFYWEVLNGVGVDGVGVIFPFFYAFFVFLRIFSLFFAFLRFSSLFSSPPKRQGQTTAKFTARMGNFTPTPSAPTPCKTSRS